jgi:hypothetical protein
MAVAPPNEPGGMKVPLTPDGSGIPAPLTPEEAAEARRQSDEWERELFQLMDDEAAFLHERYVELRDTGTTTIREPSGFWTATLQRSDSDDWSLVSEGERLDHRETWGTRPISRTRDAGSLEKAINLTTAQGLLWLREG